MANFDDMFPDYEADPSEIMQMYADFWEEVEYQAMRLSELPPTSNTQSLLLLQLAIINALSTLFSSFRVDLGDTIVEMVEDSYMEGLAYTSYSLNESPTMEVARAQANPSGFTKRNIDTLKNQAKKELLEATTNTEQGVKDFIRREVAKAIATTGGRNIKVSEMQEKVSNSLRKQRLKEGLTESAIAIVDAGKNRWKLKTYLNMAVKTQLANAHMQAIREEAMNSGADLAIISTKPGTSDACLNFEGMVISLNGLSAGYPTYESIRASKLCFHPNCGHFVRPVGGIEWIPKDHMDTHEKKLAKYRKWEEQQKESQSA